LIKIAMIEDDAELASILIEYLKDFDIEIENFEDPFIGLGALSIKKYDLLILDIPVIISSARSSIVDKVGSLKIGADDYLPKPYDPRELEVRIKAVLRRYEKQAGKNLNPKEKESYLFSLDLDKKEIRKNSKAIRLTAAEYVLLSFFIQKRGFIISREDLLDEINFEHEEYNFDGSLAVIIFKL